MLLGSTNPNLSCFARHRYFRRRLLRQIHVILFRRQTSFVQRSGL